MNYLTFSKGMTPITRVPEAPEFIYTGSSMTLICSPPQDLNVGNISDSDWRFNGLEITLDSDRIETSLSDRQSTLKINEVILGDVGKSRLD